MHARYDADDLDSNNDDQPQNPSPQQPGPPNDPPPDSAPAYAGEPSSDARTMAMLAHLLGIFTGFIGALVIWLVKKDDEPFVDDQGKEALNFQITIAIAAVVSVFGSALCCVLVPLAMIVMVGNIVFCIIAALEANKGVAYRYPVTLRFIT